MPANTEQQPFIVDKLRSIELRDLRHLLPESPSFRTLQRWCHDGRKNRHTGEIIRLPSINNGRGSAATTVAAYEWWIDRLNEKSMRVD